MVGALLATFALAGAASAAFIIDDTFTAANNTALVGRFPAPTNPGFAYGGNGNVSIIGGPTGGTPYEADIQSNRAIVGSDAGLGVNLGISTPTQFQLTITFNINGSTETQANDPRRGAALGFFSSLAIASGGSSHGFNNFTGLTVDRTGSVRLIAGGANTGIFTSVAGFNRALDHTLTYTVNTAAGVGTISSILLDGSSVALTAPANTFTIARTVYGGFYNSSGNPADLASFDNFNIATVPEPSALLSVVVLLGMVELHHRCVRRRAQRREQG